MTDIENKPTIAAFDFDGTLTYRDSLMPFLIYVRGKLFSTIYITMVLPWLIGFVIRLVPRQTAKEKLLAIFLKGEHMETISRWGKLFAKQQLSSLLRPEAMERYYWHKKQGHRCILVSASVNIYLLPWAQEVGFDDVISSRLQITAQNTISGKLSGLNCWGPEKVKRLDELLGDRSKYILYAYGDSRGDKELLNYADYAYIKRFS